ncbi:MAG: hydrogen gas-evolving membrane-bound hydrogenase subunit E [Ilumatobacteraceae bacterium]
MIWIVVLLCVVGGALFVSGNALGHAAFAVAAAPLLAATVWLLAQLEDVVDGGVRTEHLDWVPSLGLGIDLRLDGFALLMALLVTGIGVAVCAYSVAYFEGRREGLGRSSGLILLFAAAMLVIVFADNLVLLFVGWELTTVTSYLLIGNDHTKLHARAAALHALLVTSFGGLVMLAGFVLLGQAAGTYRLSAILAAPPSGTTVEVAIALVLVGAFTKSAQYPFHSWLPGAMAAPTPISAYLHSATMVKAGVYLIARFAPAFHTVELWRPVVLGVGLFTMIAGGLRALRQHDLKLLLAFGTVSQLGFLVVLFGAGTPKATVAGCVMLIAHAFFKAALFMSVGTLDRRTGTRDLRAIPRLGVAWRPFMVLTAASAASMVGLPALLGLVGKEEAYAGLEEATFAGAKWALAGLVVGSSCTVAYACRFVWGAFGPAESRVEARGDSPADVRTHPQAPSFGYLAPLAALTAVSVVLGVMPGSLDGLVGVATDGLYKTADSPHLAVWHGVNLPLVLSMVAVAAGALMFVGRRWVAPVLARGAAVPSGTAVYLWLLRGTNTLAGRVTAVVQSGSLPIYAGVTLLTAATVPGLVLVLNTSWPGLPQLAESPGQLAACGVLLAAALATATVRRRFSAALFLGTAGYAMAGLFVAQGAPDLALTQVAIETLSTVLFVLVLRRLPSRFERTSTSRRRVLRLVVAGVVGVSVFTLAIVSRDAREAIPVSAEMIERSYPDGHGKNVVNVILVDFRGLDTMGEITVLVAAAIGAVALARAGRGAGRRAGPAATTVEEATA